jgi:ribonuclease HI
MPIYAVAKGKKPGIYDNWNDCREQTVGFRNSIFKKFMSRALAQKYIDSFDCKYEDTELFIYTDGSCKKDGTAGYGCCFAGEMDDPRNISKVIEGKSTNNVAELMGAMAALDYAFLHPECKITIVTDSMYVMNSLYNDNCTTNVELVLKFQDMAAKARNVNFMHVNSHTGATDKHSIGNHYADILAAT